MRSWNHGATQVGRQGRSRFLRIEWHCILRHQTDRRFLLQNPSVACLIVCAYTVAYPCYMMPSHNTFVGHTTNMSFLSFPQCRASLLLPLPGYLPVTSRGSGDVSIILFASSSSNSSRPVARGVRGCDAPPQICQKVHFLPQSGLKMGFYEGGLGQKSPLFVTKWVKNGVLTEELGPNGSLSGVPDPLKSSLATGLNSSFMEIKSEFGLRILQFWIGVCHFS